MTTTPHQSDQIDQIAKAVAEFQKEIVQPAKTAVNPHFRNGYAPLDEVLDAILPRLHEFGLAVIQSTRFDEVTLLRTVLMHISGQWLAGEYPLMPIKNDPQQLGSAMTYARRYTLKGFFGLAEVDDDGNFASGNARQQSAPAPKSIAPKPAPPKPAPPKPAPAGEVSEEIEDLDPAPAKTASDPGNFVVTLGSQSGKKLRDVPLTTIEAYTRLAVGSDDAKRQLKDAALDYLKKAKSNGSVAA